MKLRPLVCRAIMVPVTALGLCLGTVGHAARAENPASKYDLRYKFQPGEEVRTNVVHQATVRTTIDGSSQTASTVSKSDKVWRIKSVDGRGHIHFVHWVDHVDMRNEVTGREAVHYDSRQDQKPPPGFEDVAKRVGVPLTIVTMDDRGRVLKREDKAPPVGAGQGGQITLPLPEEPVAIGQSWTIPNDVQIQLRSGEIKLIKARQRFTLRSVDGDVAEIGVETQTLTPVNDPEIQAQLIEHDTTGTVKFDVAAGRILSQKIDLDRSVVGYPNVKSSMHYRTRFSEELVPAGDRTARKPEKK